MFFCWRFEIITAKKHGVISGQQTCADGEIEWSKQLPQTCQLSRYVSKWCLCTCRSNMFCHRNISLINHLPKQVVPSTWSCATSVSSTTTSLSISVLPAVYYMEVFRKASRHTCILFCIHFLLIVPLILQGDDKRFGITIIGISWDGSGSLFIVHFSEHIFVIYSKRIWIIHYYILLRGLHHNSIALGV